MTQETIPYLHGNCLIGGVIGGALLVNGRTVLPSTVDLSIVDAKFKAAFEAAPGLVPSVTRIRSMRQACGRKSARSREPDPRHLSSSFSSRRIFFRRRLRFSGDMESIRSRPFR